MPSVDSQIVKEGAGNSIPALGFGTWELKGAVCRDAVRVALESGYRHVDTARMYENEETVGEGLRDSGVPRERVFLTTKVWLDDLEPSRVQSSMEESLDELRTDYVDLLLIHWPNAGIPLRETLSAMNQLKEKGQCRSIGVSNFPPSLLREALNVSAAPICVIQVEYHPFLGQEALLGLCDEKDILLTAYCPLAQGRVVHDEQLSVIGRAYGKTATQVALRWLVQQEPVVAIPRSGSPAHIRQNIEIFDFELDDQHMLEIHDLNRGQRLINPDFAPDWES